MWDSNSVSGCKIMHALPSNLFMVSIQPCQLFFSKLLKIQMKVIILGISQLYHTLLLNIHFSFFLIKNLPIC